MLVWPHSKWNVIFGKSKSNTRSNTKKCSIWNVAKPTPNWVYLNEIHRINFDYSFRVNTGKQFSPKSALSPCSPSCSKRRHILRHWGPVLVHSSVFAQLLMENLEWKTTEMRKGRQTDRRALYSPAWIGAVFFPVTIKTGSFSLSLSLFSNRGFCL